MTSRATMLGVAFAALIGSCGPRTLQDSDLTAYARSTFDARAMEGKSVVVGVHRGIPVLAEFPCSDLCPAHTTRIIHYDLPADDTCTKGGGTRVHVGTPVGIGYLPVEYCVPRVLSESLTGQPS